jgi:hypothetical protein
MDLLKDTCTITGKTITGYGLDEFQKNWAAHIAFLKEKNLIPADEKKEPEKKEPEKKEPEKKEPEKKETAPEKKKIVETKKKTIQKKKK